MSQTIVYLWYFILVAISDEKKRLRKKILAALRSVETFDDESHGAAGVTPEEEQESSRVEVARERLSSIDLGSSDEEEEIVVSGGSQPALRPARQEASDLGADNQGTTEAVNEPAVAPVRPQEEGIFAAPSADEETAGPIQEKLRLLTRFGHVVHVYLLLLLGMLVYDAWKHEHSEVLTIIKDQFDLLCLGALLWTFRLRETNPYYVLEGMFDDSEEEDTALEMEEMSFPSAVSETPITDGVVVAIDSEPHGGTTHTQGRQEPSDELFEGEFEGDLSFDEPPETLSSSLA